MTTFLNMDIMKTKILFLLVLIFNKGILLAQLPASLYIVGNATPTGWHIDNAIPLQTLSPGVYKYSGPLFAGNYKFANSQSTCWCQDFYVKDANDAAKVVKNGADNQWVVSALAQYDVTVNLNTLSISVQQTSLVPNYKDFWIIGDATPAGWNMDNVISQRFSANPNNPAEYYYQGNLSAGEFKIFMGAFNDFNGSFYMPMSNHQDSGNVSAQAVNNPAFDYKWQITSAGNYTVIVNPSANTVKVQSGIVLGVKDTADKNLSFYPNPSKGQLFVRGGQNVDNGTVAVHSFEGKFIGNYDVRNGQVNMTDLKPGNYLIKYSVAQKQYLSKVIIQ